MSELMFFEIPEKEGFSFECEILDRQEKNLYSQGWDIFDLGDKNLKVLKFPVIPWGVLHCLRRRKDGFTGDIMLTGSVGTFESLGKSPLALSASFVCIL